MTRLPVLMFIHGESYEWNAGSTVDGSVLASATDMVVVTINFRLGILGKKRLIFGAKFIAFFIDQIFYKAFSHHRADLPAATLA